MAFSLTFNSILENNIRHVYSGMPVQMSYRHSSEYPNMDQLRQKRDNQQLKNFVLRTSEYQSDYNCLIPRAPAFRLVGKTGVDEIVGRLGSQTVASKRQDGHSEKETVKAKQENNPKYLGLKKVSKAEMDEIVERVNKPTKMSIIRERPQNSPGMPEVA